MMTTGSTPGKPGFSSAAPAKGPTAGFDPVMGRMMKRKKNIGTMVKDLLDEKEMRVNEQVVERLRKSNRYSQR